MKKYLAETIKSMPKFEHFLENLDCKKIILAVWADKTGEGFIMRGPRFNCPPQLMIEIGEAISDMGRKMLQ